MALKYARYAYSVAAGQPYTDYVYNPPSFVVGAWILVRAGGGGGASGQRHDEYKQCLAGPGGGGGGASQFAGIVMREDMPPQVPVRVGAGGAGGVGVASSMSGEWNVGENGHDSYFGDLLFAGGGGGGGRRPLSDGSFVKDITAGGAAGYGMSRGGRGLTYLDIPRRLGGNWLYPRNARISEADAFNELHMVAGGGGGGIGKGWTGRYNSDNEWRQTDYPWRVGGNSNAMQNNQNPGWNGSWDTAHYLTMHSGCGGNGQIDGGGTGGQGGYPSGGGAGGSGSAGPDTVSRGGAGRNGMIVVIQLEDR